MSEAKWLRLVLVMVALTAMTGCWDYKEYESMALVRTIGIDVDKSGKFLLTYEIIKTHESNMDGNKAKEVVQGAGKTLTEAFDNLQTVVPEELFLGYATSVIISEDAAKRHLRTIMDLLFINPSMRESVFLAFTKDKPEEILKLSIGKSDLLVGESLVDFFKISKSVGVSFPVRLREFNKMLMAEGVEPVAPSLRIDGNGKLKLSDIVVFDGFKPAGVLDGEQSKGLARIVNLDIQERPSITIQAPGTGHSVTAVFRISDNRSRIRTVAGKDAPEAFIKTKANATMIQIGGDIEAITPDILRACERELERLVKSEIEAAIAKAQKEYKSDFLGIGQIVYRQHRGQWKTNYKPKWDDVFPKVPIHADVKIKVLNSGTKVVPLSEQ
ncbi:Ger(x)C family spore germination protein [Cohnella sp. GCM10027633]|uniref:Ger(x)C family spore germination protein n=1 Tax=unclassified Cohnella TaxID=2636738 RepID=UPI003629EED9